MSKIDYQTLREAAEKATPDEWVAFISTDTGTYAVHTPGDERCEDVIKWTGFDGQKNAENNARYIAAFNPEVVQALLDELEGKDSKIANLTAERDALREGEMGDARHSNTRAAADIYFQLVEECEIPAGGSLVEYVDDMREKLEAAKKRIAELEAREISLPERSSMLHRTDFHEDYQTVMAYKVSEVIAAIRAAGIRIKGE
ncbi:ead/Ea22-like family protein [Escherichia coli]|uniref:ead/Ea22-like family protein n=1 Tax=Escherichia coli TaxID=562 RepID=UPI001303ADEC|nr:ead/Ea22-like family protein [Escherichia coli]KAE9904184.1 ead/Ea22-like family protein [Escherichia coli]MXG42845.1 ead/Ea22-like family protein [Escherichia coli]